MSSSVGLRAAGTLDILVKMKRTRGKETSKLLRVRKREERYDGAQHEDSDETHLCDSQIGAGWRLFAICLLPALTRISTSTELAAVDRNRLFFSPFPFIASGDPLLLPQSIEIGCFFSFSSHCIGRSLTLTATQNCLHTHSHATTTLSSVRLDPCLLAQTSWRVSFIITLPHRPSASSPPPRRWLHPRSPSKAL